jgi:hypothetical protein
MILSIFFYYCFRKKYKINVLKSNASSGYSGVRVIVAIALETSAQTGMPGNASWDFRVIDCVDNVVVG